MATSQQRRRIVSVYSSAACSRAPLILAALLLGSGCVSQSAFEEAQSAAQVEREAHLRAEARMVEAERALAALQGDLTRREAALTEQERRLAEADLNLKLAHQERDQSGQLVDQLRGELARVGDHLRVYSEQKDRLTEELRAAEGRSVQLDARSERLERFAGIVRDLSLLEGPAIHAGAVLVGSNGRDPMLSAPAQALGSGATLSADADRIVKALARLAELHPYARFVISDTASDVEASDPARLRALSAALIAAGVASDRVAVAMPEAPQQDEGAPEPSAAPAADDAPKPAASEARVIVVIQVDGATKPEASES